MTTWVLVHGTPLTPEIWAPVAVHLDGTVITPDCTRVPDRRATAELAADVAAHLPREETVHLVGHSFGGQIAIDLALTHPHAVRSLTILCSRDTPVPAFADLADHVRAGDVPEVSSTLERWFTADELAAAGAAVQSARRALAVATAHPANWAHALQAIAEYDRSERVGELRMPVFLHAAGHDGVSTPDAMRAFAGRIPGATLTVHDEWAHMSPFVDPAACARMMSDAVQP